MTTVQEAVNELYVALQRVEGVKIYPAYIAGPSTPAIVIGAPALNWDKGFPVDATVDVFLIVGVGERDLERLYQLIEEVPRVIEDGTSNASVESSSYVTYTVGSNSALPAYAFQTKLSLGG